MFNFQTPDIFSTTNMQEIFSKTYLRDGYDPYKMQDEFARRQEYTQISLARSTVEDSPAIAESNTMKLNLTSFFGLPNRLSRSKFHEELTWKLLVKNFFGVPDNFSYRSKKFVPWLIILVPLVALNLVTIVLKTGFNFVKLFTEFLPLLAIIGVNKGFETLEKKAEKNNYEMNVPRKLLYQSVIIPTLRALLISISVLIQGLYLLGRAATSPVNSMRAAWSYANAHYSIWNEDGTQSIKYRVNNKYARWSLGVGLTLLSLTTSLAIYVIAWPLTVHAIALKVPALFNFFASLYATVANPFNVGILHQIALAILNVSQWGVTQLLAHTVGMVTALLDISLASFAVAAVTIAALAENIRKPLANWWYQSKPTYFDLIRATNVDKKSKTESHKKPEAEATYSVLSPKEVCSTNKEDVINNDFNEISGVETPEVPLMRSHPVKLSESSPNKPGRHVFTRAIEDNLCCNWAFNLLRKNPSPAKSMPSEESIKKEDTFIKYQAPANTQFS